MRFPVLSYYFRVSSRDATVLSPGVVRQWHISPAKSLNHRPKVVSFRGFFPRNPVSVRTFELDRRDSLFGLRAQPAL